MAKHDGEYSRGECTKVKCASGKYTARGSEEDGSGDGDSEEERTQFGEEEGQEQWLTFRLLCNRALYLPHPHSVNTRPRHSRSWIVIRFSFARGHCSRSSGLFIPH